MEKLVGNQKTVDQIISRWKQIEGERPGIRIREAAAALQLSEAQLLATRVGSEAIRLKPKWKELLKRLPELGRVMSLTRNQECILEHKGIFEKVNVFGKGDHHMATVIGPIETRVFLNSWHVAFAVRQTKNDRTLTSLQVFDHEGQAITKIYLQNDSNYEAYRALVDDFRSDDQRPVQDVSAYSPKTFSEKVDRAGLLAEWADLKDTHDFFPLLKKYEVARFRAMQLAEGSFSSPLPVTCIQEMLETAAKVKVPIMIFAGNRGNLQIHQDKVRTIRFLERGHTGKEKWLNVLDPDFNMHLRIDLIQHAWVVTKPTRDGEVTSIECYNENRELVVQFFGLRKPGKPELPEWKALIDSLTKEAATS